MQFFEPAACLGHAVPGGLVRALFVRELTAMFTAEAEWVTRSDLSELSSNSVSQSMSSRDLVFSKRLANAICARSDTEVFVWRMSELGLAAQELIAHNITTYGDYVDLAYLAYHVTEQLVGLLHTKAGLKDKTADLEQFLTFFSDVARGQLEAVEYYHHALTGILEKQLAERRRRYQTQATALQTAIRSQQAQIISPGESVQFHDEIYQRSFVALQTEAGLQ